MYLCFHRLCQKYGESVFLTLLNALQYLLLYQTSPAAVMMETVWKMPSSAALPEKSMLPPKGGSQLWQGWSSERLEHCLLYPYRITEWLKMEGTLSRGHLVHPPCSKQGQLKYVTESCVQQDFAFLHRWRLHNQWQQTVPSALSASQQIPWICVCPVCLMFPNLIVLQQWQVYIALDFPLGLRELGLLKAEAKEAQSNLAFSIFFAIESLLHVVTGSHFVWDALYSF